MKRILLINENKRFTCFLKGLLKIENFDVLINYNTKKIFKLLDNSIDLILFDIIFSEENAINTLKKIRQICQTPIIILTPYEKELDNMLNLEIDVDDFLLKPFNNRELIARIRVIFRRSELKSYQENNHSNLSTLQIDSLVLDPNRHEASFDGKHIRLTGTEFALIYTLAKNLGQVVSREYLSQKVLRQQFTPFDRAIDVHISNLRHKLPKRRDGYPWFKTLRGRGYLMVPILQ